MQKYRINKTIEQITLIAGNIRTFFAPQKNYVGVDCYSCSADGCTGQTNKDGCPIIKKAKILPDEMLTVNAAGKITDITNPFGGQVNLYTSNKTKSGDKQAFSIYYKIGNNLEACIELLTNDWTDAGVTTGLGFKGLPVPLLFKASHSFDDIVDQCSLFTKNANDEGDPSVVFYFDIDVNSTLWKNVVQ